MLGRIDKGVLIRGFRFGTTTQEGLCVSHHLFADDSVVLLPILNNKNGVDLL